MKTKKPWGGRFKESTLKSVEEFTASIRFDLRLYRYDIQGSIAHCKALTEAGVLTQAEEEKIVKALQEIQQDIQREIQSGQVEFSVKDEDVHMMIEARLIKKLGELGGKLHTARSRNDQVALDIRLYLRDEIKILQGGIHGLEQALLRLAKSSLDVAMPGYTHLQRAQPILFAHWPLAYFEMLERDQQRLSGVLTRVNILPLGSGALAGVNYPINRRRVAKLLGFPQVTKNSLDAVSDRDFIIEFLSTASLIMMHLSRLAEELILWSSQEFNFVELPDRLCTGSSLMPQKKNPDVLELIRAKTGRVYGGLFSLMTVMKGLPLAYNRDLQEDKEPLFDALETVKACLEMATAVVEGLRLRKPVMQEAAMDSFLLAADLADYLVGKGVAFRKAHEIVGRVVRYAMEHQKSLLACNLKEYRKFSKRFEKDALDFLALEKSLARKGLLGGTGPQALQRQIKEATETLRKRQF
jgi:argininosuccinate lyase